jgi:2-oxoisovalerate dehydrogenase E1 component
MAKFRGFTKTQLLDHYRTMATARSLDEKMLVLLRQGRGYFHIGCSGHEAAQVAAASCFKPGSDWAFPYYRDAAFTLQWGMTPRDHFLGFFARKDDPASGGRQMPQHYGRVDLRIPSQSSPTGTQFLQAVGVALAARKEDLPDVVYVSSGEGTTSQGDFHEALNWASREKLSVIFHIQDNDYAISTHISEQTAGGSVYKISAGYDSLARFEVNGTDFFETRLAFAKATERARRREGPSLIVSHVPRLLPHSSSDDQRKYRSEKDLGEDRARDPLLVFRQALIENEIATDKEFEAVDHQVKEQIDEATKWSEEQPLPEIDSAHLYIFDEAPSIAGESVPEPTSSGDVVMLVDAINHALQEEMAGNEKMVIYGQDVAGEKGGVFTATRNLTKEFGAERVFNSPLAESSIIGTAIGIAMAGWKPVVEIQFGDYIWTGMMQLRNELAAMRSRSNNSWAVPVVIRVAVGGYIHGGAYHSQSIDGTFAHIAGLRIAYPSNAGDAKGLLKTACRMNDPVLFMEHKGLYRQRYAAVEEPDPGYLLPFGRARIAQEGDDATIITWGAMVKKSLDAAATVRERMGAGVEIIDLRTLNPLDMDTIMASVERTNRVVIVHEDLLTGGFGAEIAARIADGALTYLDAPVKRVAAYDCPAIPYSPGLEEQILPQVSWIEDALMEVLSF